MLSKIISALISPLGTALVLVILALGLLHFAVKPRWRRVGFCSGVFAVSWLWLWSAPVVSDALCGWIESQAGPRSLQLVPQANVMVVLGGGVSGPRPPLRLDPDLNASADRLWHAARLYHAGKAPRLLLSGGTVRSGDGSEAEAMQRFLLDMGVPAKAMELESGSDNTASNALLTSRLLKTEGVDQIILVTSALHMPRARSSFEKAGLKVTPAPTDFEVIEMPFDLLRVIPDADALDASARAMKEILGRIAGR